MTLCDAIDTSGKDKESLNLPKGVPTLREFYLYLTSVCNLRCRHCWVDPTYDGGILKPSTYIDFKLLQQAIEEGKELGLSSVKLTGGEPLLHPNFTDIVAFLTENKLSIRMETNGTLITPELAHFLKCESSVSFISVSIDSPVPMEHDRFRGVKGAYDKTLSALDNLVNAGYKNCQVIMSVHQGNRHQIWDLVELAASHGAGSVKLNSVISTGRGNEMEKKGETLSLLDHLRLKEYVNKELRPNSRIPVSYYLPPALTPLDEFQNANWGCGDCGVTSILSIIGSGDIALCGIGQTISDLTYGYLGVDSIKDIWFYNPTILKLRSDLDNIDEYQGICSSCIHAKACRTGCVANNYVQNGILVSPQWLCEEAHNAGLFPKTRMK